MKTRTPEERAALLIKAKILDENGNYHKDFFRPETVEKSKARKANALELTLKEAGKELPTNSPFGENDFDFKKRELDCAVIRYAIEMAADEGIHFDSVRAAFWEGEELYPNAGFKTHNHIQLCIINPDCIKGIFLPRKKTD